MSLQHQTTVKSWFETGDFPTQTQFADFIESSMPEWQMDVAIQADGGATGLINILSTVSATVVSPSAAVVGGFPTWLRQVNASVADLSQTGALIMVNSSAVATLVSGRGDPRAGQGVLWAALLSANSPGQNVAAIESCVSAVSPIGTVLLPRGTYEVTALSTITGAISIVGKGPTRSGTTLRCMATTGNVFHFDGGDGASLEGVRIAGGVTRAGGASLVVGGSAANFRCVDVCSDFMYDGIYINNSRRTFIRGFHCRNPLGQDGIHIFDPAATVENIMVTEYSGHFPFVAAPSPATQVDYAAATSIAVGKITHINGHIYESIAGGTTSAGSSATPTGVPGTTGADACYTTITDGGVSWRWRGRRTFSWLRFEGGARNGYVSDMQVEGGGFGALMTNDVSGAAAAPFSLAISDSLIDRSFGDNVFANTGSVLKISGSRLYNSINGRNANIAAGFSGGAIIINNEAFISRLDGIVIGAGVGGSVISGNIVHFTGVASAAGTYDDLRVDASAMRTTITGNILGAAYSSPSVAARNLRMAVGASNFYAITGNVCVGGTNALSDGGTGTWKMGATVTANNAIGVP